MIRDVLIADDHPICLMALREATLSLGGEFRVTTVEKLSDVQSELRRRDFAALILDLALADYQGLSNVSLVRSTHPKLPILVVSGNDASPIPQQVAGLGAKGFLSKSASIAEMKSAIDVVLRGGSYFSGFDQVNGPANSGLEQLSPAQTKVTVERARGSSNKIIAHELGLSEDTVKSHLSAIYKTLGVTNRSQAILALQQSGAKFS